MRQDPTPKGGGLQFQISFPENALSGTDCNRLLDESPILLRTENYANTNRIRMQACSANGGTCAFLPTPKGRGFSRFFGDAARRLRAEHAKEPKSDMLYTNQ